MIPKVNDNDEFIILAEWYIEEGDFVKVGTPLCCLESSKATFDLESEVEGYIKEIRYNPDDEIELFKVICIIVDSLTTKIPNGFIEEFEKEHTTIYNDAQKTIDSSGNEIMATIEANKMALKHKLDLASIQKKGIIRKKDVEEFLNNQANESFERKSDLIQSVNIELPPDHNNGNVCADPLITKTDSSDRKSKYIAVYGAGDHGILIKDMIDSFPDLDFAGFLDSEKPIGTIISNGKVIGDQSSLKHLRETDVEEIFVTVFDRHLREELNEEGREYGLKIATFIHPTAIIGDQVDINEGCFIKAGAIIDSYSSIGAGTIVDNGVIIAHHCNIGRYCHLTPGVVTGGRVKIGDYTLIAIGAQIMSLMEIGDNCWVDIGCSVKKSFLNSQLFIGGNPAKIKKQGKINRA